MAALDKRPTLSKSRLSVLLLIAGLVAIVLAACPVAVKSPAALMHEYLRAAQRYWSFQGSVLVARNGAVVIETGIGSARLEENESNSPATRFLIGSVTKTLTAAAVLQLAEKGLLDLDDPLLQYVPEYPEKPGPAITIRHLLTHTSGVPEAVPDPQIIGDLSKPRAPIELVGLVRDKPLDFVPGERASYSNAGYVLLGVVIERVSGKSYYDYLQDHIFGPLGMTSSGTREDRDGAPGFARGYNEAGDGRLAEAPWIHPSLGFSAGALYSTVRDLLKWDEGLRSDAILASASKELVSRAAKDGFGYGWLVSETWGRTELAHGGGAPGFGAWIARWPVEGAFVAVLGNVGGSPVGEIGRSLAAILFDESYQPPESRAVFPLSPDSLDDYAGTYRIAAGRTREILREGNALYVTRNGERRYPILPYAADKFFFANDKGATIRFVRDSAGRITGHVFHRLGLDEAAALEFPPPVR